MPLTLVKTFASLELQETVTAAELIETLRDYATSGAAIDYHVVCAIVDRVKPDEVEREVLKRLAQAGVDKQASLNQAAALYHYHVLRNHIALGPRP